MRFLAHLALEGAFPENGSDTFTHMDIYENGSTCADNFYHYDRKRTVVEWFERIHTGHSSAWARTC